MIPWGLQRLVPCIEAADPTGHHKEKIHIQAGYMHKIYTTKTQTPQ
jgi:hypothetical protein